MCNAVVEAFAVAKRSLQELKKSKSRAKGCSFATLRINWPPPKLKSPHLRRNLRRPKRQISKQKGLRIKTSKMGMTSEWQKPRKPSGLRSRGYVGLIAPKRGIKLSTRLGLRIHPCLERQRTYITPCHPAVYSLWFKDWCRVRGGKGEQGLHNRCYKLLCQPLRGG